MLAPDGCFICFADARNLYSVPFAGGPPRKVTSDDERDFDPVWSPAGGGRIYFSSHRGRKLGLWSVDTAGEARVTVLSGIGEEGHPSLSRDGMRMIVANEIPYAGELVLLDRQSNHSRTLLRAEGRMASIAPDKSKIAFVDSRPGSKGRGESQR